MLTSSQQTTRHLAFNKECKSCSHKDHFNCTRSVGNFNKEGPRSAIPIKLVTLAVGQKDLVILYPVVSQRALQVCPIYIGMQGLHAHTDSRSFFFAIVGLLS